MTSESSNPSDRLPPEAIAAAERGDSIEAIKITREKTGQSLEDAKDAVDAYRRGRGPYGRAGLAGASRERPGSLEASRAGETLGSDIPSEAIGALYQGRLIDAIKVTREKTGLGLKDSKDAVEAHLARNPTTNQRFRAAAADSRRGLVQALKLLVLAGIVTLAYLWLSGRL
jgi:ribosomal protein L7/L12